MQEYEVHFLGLPQTCSVHEASIEQQLLQVVCAPLGHGLFCCRRRLRILVYRNEIAMSDNMSTPGSYILAALEMLEYLKSNGSDLSGCVKTA